MVDVSTIRLEGARGGPESDLLCTCPHPPPSSSTSHSLIATAAILPPPPSFLCGEPPGQVQTVAISQPRQLPASTAGFVTLPRHKARTHTAPGQDEEVRLVPFFDGIGPRTSANGSQDPQSGWWQHYPQIASCSCFQLEKIFSCSTKIVAHFCSNSRNSLILKYPIYYIVLYTACHLPKWRAHHIKVLTLSAGAVPDTLPPPPMFCTMCEEEPDIGVSKKKNKQKKKGFVPNENCFSTLPNVRSQSFSTKNSNRDDSKAGIQVWAGGIKTRCAPN